MKCTKCSSCFEGAICPNCGSSIITTKKKSFYKTWWFWVIVGFLVIGISGNTNTQTNTPNEADVSEIMNQDMVEATKENNDSILETETTTADTYENLDARYAEDAVINDFITEFNSASQFEMTNIRKGNIRTKYYASANDCYIEMINAIDNLANCFSVSINGGRTDADKQRMFAVFAEVAAILDPNLPREDVEDAIAYLQNSKYMVSDYRISESLLIETYVPIIEMSTGKTDCRIDIIVYNYN